MKISKRLQALDLFDSFLNDLLIENKPDRQFD